MKKIIMASVMVVIGISLVSAPNMKLLFEQGMEAFRSGNFGSSGLLFKKVVDSDDEDFKDIAFYYLALSIYQQKKYKSAIFEFNSYLNKCRTTKFCIETRFWIAEAYNNLNDYNNAIEEYKRFILNSKDKELQAVSHDRIGMIYYKQQRYDESAVEWENALSTSTDKHANSDRIIRIGEALYGSGKYNESLKRLMQLLTPDNNPKTTERARLLMGRIYKKTGNYEKAISLFKSIIQNISKNPSVGEVNFYLAESYIETGKSEAAIPYLETFLLTGGGSELYYNAMYALSLIYMDKNMDDKVLGLLQNIISHSGKPVLISRASLLLGKIYLMSEPELAIPFLEGCISMENIPDLPDLLILLCRIYIESGNLSKADKIINFFIEKYPYDKGREEVEFLRISLSLAREDTEKAVEILNRMKLEYPFSIYLHEYNYYLAVYNYKKLKYNNALNLIREYLKVINVQNKYAANRLLVDCYLVLGDVKNAQYITDQLIEQYIRNRGIEKVIYKTGIALKKNGANPDKYFKIIMSSFSESEEAGRLYSSMADGYFQAKNYGGAEEFYKKFLMVKNLPGRGAAYYNRLISLYVLGRYQDIVSIVKNEKIPALDESQWAGIPLILGRCYFRLNKFDKAYEMLTKCDFSQFGAEDLMIFVKSALAVGDIISASKAADHLEENFDKSLEAKFSICEYYLKHNQVDESINILKNIILKYPGSDNSERSMLKLAEINIVQKKFDKAYSLLIELKRKTTQDQKNFLLLKVYMGQNNTGEADKLTKNEFRSLLQSDHGEEFIMINVMRSFEDGDAGRFEFFSGYLKKFEGNEQLLYCLSGRLYYRLAQYEKAYNNYYKLTIKNNIYFEESLYYVAMINLYINKNQLKGINDLKKLLQTGRIDSLYHMKARINLAIIYKENNMNAQSKEILKETTEYYKGSLYGIQSQNLLEVYNK